MTKVISRGLKSAQLLPHLFGSIIRTLEKRMPSLGSFLAVFAAIIIMRIVLQQSLNYFPRYDASGQFYEFSQTFLFFLFSFTLFVFFLYGVARIRPRQSVPVLLAGFLIILLPPVIDKMRFDTYWSYYEFASIEELWYALWTLFAATPNIGITDGSRFEIVLSILAMGGYVFMHTKSAVRATIGAIGAYGILFILASLPSWIAIGAYGWQKGFLSVTAVDVAQMFLAPNPILMRPIEGVTAVLHVHMSIIYALGMVVLGLLYGYVFHRDILRNVVKGLSHWHAASTLIFLGCGIVSAFLFGFQTAHIFALSAFAVPAFVLLIITVMLFITGIGVFYGRGAQRDPARGALMIGAAFLFGLIVNPFIAVPMIAILALSIMSNEAPLFLRRYTPARYGIFVVQSMLLYRIGVTAVAPEGSDILMSWRLIGFVAVVALGIVLVRDLCSSRRLFGYPMRHICALYWFMCILSTLIFFNLFAYKIVVLLCASAAFVGVYLHTKRCTQSNH